MQMYGVGPMKGVHLNDYRRDSDAFISLSCELLLAPFLWSFYTSILGRTVSGGYSGGDCPVHWVGAELSRVESVGLLNLACTTSAAIVFLIDGLIG
jgi:hypothetical protein